MKVHELLDSPEPRVGAAVKRYHQQAWPKLWRGVKPGAWRELAWLEERAERWGMATFRFPAIEGSDWQDELDVIHESYHDHIGAWQYQDAEYKHNGFIYRMCFGPRQPSEPVPGRNAAAHMLSIGGVS